MQPERGTALVGTLVGFAIVLVLLLFAAQMIVRLYATSVLTGAAFSAARQVAQSPAAQQAGVAVAQQDAERSLGGFGAEHTQFHWLEVDGRQVVLQVTARSPGFLPLPASFRQIRRTVTVRTERFR
ncbi:MAG: hypothetical protein J2P57_22660 [Acidimicrobiaceae bacterium]|nr:hypothetical protein [Acidimicrobiaceae bacterium]